MKHFLIILVALLLAALGRSVSAAGPLVITESGTYTGLTIDAQCSSDNGIVVEADNVTLFQVTVLNANEAGIRVYGDNVTVQSSLIQGFNCAGLSGQYRAGVACWGCTDLEVRDSHIETDKTFGNGIWVKNYGTGTGGHHVFGHNTIIGGFDGIGGEPEGQPYGGVYKRTLIYGNTVRGCADDGIQVEGGNDYVIVSGNDVSGCGLGIALAPTITGPLWVYRNNIHDLVPGYYGALACFKVGDGGGGAAYFLYNTCRTDGDGWKQTNGGLNPFWAKGNCIQVSRYVIEFGDTPSASGTYYGGTLFDYDVMDTTDPDRFVKWGGTRYPSLAAFQATGQEMNGTEGSC